LVGAEEHPDRLRLGGMREWRPLEGPFEDADDVIAGEQAGQHGHTCGHSALDQNPTEILEVLEEGLYWPTLFFLR